ncbi:HesA/MoeB/ThiF family protein [Sulfuricella denitrificans]|uniref:HesA/MoeB/ThiF family protein n=1 Tax=Sulfuricella denitrificans TaxID=649841 RepID=UPI0018E07738|nr:ThiF family adenylyltransferase [Sulfuricella denitrificans]
MLEPQMALLRKLLFDRMGVEGAAFLLCGQSQTERATKLIAHVIMPIAEEDFLYREAYGLSISSSALVRITKQAKIENLSIIFAHSHPEGFADFSDQDDGEELKLLPFLQKRVPDRVHGTLVLTENDIRGRLYLPHQEPADVILEVGARIRSWSKNPENEITAIFDRQVRAFGQDIQKILSNLHIGIVGLGGTGSPVAEQLCRLGVGRLSLFDGDVLDATNVNRVYGSKVDDAGQFKVEIIKRHLDSIGLKTIIDVFPKHITDKNTAESIRDCDVVFGCTDNELPRSILTQLAMHYNIPVIDLGVLISSQHGAITSVYGRVTTLISGEACLFCRGRISAEAIRVETLSDEDRRNQIRDGYAPELDEPAPAVIAFTSATASAAISELLHRLTGFMGEERQSSEVLLAFDQSRIRTNRIEPRDGCFCGDHTMWGRGDVQPYLDMVWATHTK